MVAETGGESFDELLMGSVSEQVSESDEQFRARAQAAQAKLQQVKKDEQKAHQFDLDLAKLIPSLSDEVLRFVIFLIDREVPSLTILAFLSLLYDEAGQICYREFHKYIEERADFSPVKFADPKVEEKISWWWTFILAADHVSTTLHLASLKDNTPFVDELSKHLSDMLKTFLTTHEVETFDQEALKKILQQYKNLMFEEKKELES